MTFNWTTITLVMAGVICGATVSATPSSLQSGNVSCEFKYRKGVDEFQPLNLKNSGFGFDAATYWVKATCTATGEVAEQRLLEIQYPLIDHVHAFESFSGPNGTDLRPLTRAGDQDDWNDRAIKHRNPVIPINVPAGGDVTILIKSQTDGSIQFPLRLWDAEGLALANQEEYLGLGIYYGILGALLAYNLFLLVSMRERVFAYYVLYVAAFMLLQFGLNGLLIQFLREKSYFLANNGIGMLMPMIQGFILLFSSEYLKLKNLDLGLAKITNRTGWIFCLASPLMLLLPYKISSPTGAALALVVPLYVIGLGIFASVRGYYPSRFFLTAWIIYLAGIVTLAAKNMGLIPPSFFANYSIQFGSAVEVVLLSLGLGYRIKTVEIEKTEIQARANTLTGIARGTQMLAHDVRKPFRLLLAALSDLRNAPVTDVHNLIAAKFVHVESSIATVNGMIEDILQADHGMRLHYKHFDVKSCVAENMVFAGQVHNLPSIEVEYSLNYVGQVFADRRRIDRVIQNLLSNAVEAMNGEGVIRVGVDYTQDSVKFTIGNTGSFVPKENRERIFEVFFSDEKENGTGLGLSIAKRVVTEHGGKIWCESSQTQGTDFFFTLPLTAAVKSAGDLTFEGVLPRHLGVDASNDAVAAKVESPTAVVVEDDPFIRAAWSQTFLQQGLPVVAFSSPKAFWHCVNAGSLPLEAIRWLITDFYFGDLDQSTGEDFAVELRKRTPAMKVFLSSDLQSGFNPTLFEGRIDKNPEVAINQIRAQYS